MSNDHPQKIVPEHCVEDYAMLVSSLAMLARSCSVTPAMAIAALIEAAGNLAAHAVKLDLEKPGCDASLDKIKKDVICQMFDWCDDHCPDEKVEVSHGS